MVHSPSPGRQALAATGETAIDANIRISQRGAHLKTQELHRLSAVFTSTRSRLHVCDFRLLFGEALVLTSS